MDRKQQLKQNLGTRDVRPLPPAKFPNVDDVVAGFERPRPEGAVDVMLVNPPSPDGGQTAVDVPVLLWMIIALQLPGCFELFDLLLCLGRQRTAGMVSQQ